MFQALAVHSNYLKTLEGYVASGDLDFPSLKEPAITPTLFREALSTVNLEMERVQKILKTLYDAGTVIPVHTMRRASIQQKSVHDTNHYTLGVLQTGSLKIPG